MTRGPERILRDANREEASKGKKPMEGQDVARLATAGDITDSYVEQGLEAELSVDLERNGGAGNGDDGLQSKSTLPDTPIRGTGFPTVLARATDRKSEGITSSDVIVVPSPRFRSSGVGQGGSPLCTDVAPARRPPRGSPASADATTVPGFWFRSENRGCSGDRTSDGARVTTRGQRPW